MVGHNIEGLFGERLNFYGQERERKINLSWPGSPRFYSFLFISHQSGRVSTTALGTWLGIISKDYLAKEN